MGTFRPPDVQSPSGLGDGVSDERAAKCMIGGGGSVLCGAEADGLVCTG